mgnify:CR=1 FL=1
MASSIVLSGVVALTLTPVLCAMILRRTDHHHAPRGPIAWLLGIFNKVFDRITGGYLSVTGILVRKLFRSMVLVGATAALAVVFAGRVPTGFIPDEDQGIFGVAIQLPPGASLERTSGPDTHSRKPRASQSSAATSPASRTAFKASRSTTAFSGIRRTRVRAVDPGEGGDCIREWTTPR